MKEKEAKNGANKIFVNRSRLNKIGRAGACQDALDQIQIMYVGEENSHCQFPYLEYKQALADVIEKCFQGLFQLNSIHWNDVVYEMLQDRNLNSFPNLLFNFFLQV